MSEPERKAEVVSLREVRRRKEQAAKVKPARPVARGREPIVKSWRALGLFVAALAAFLLIEALLRRLF